MSNLCLKSGDFYLEKTCLIRLTIASILIYADEILLCNQNKSMILLGLISSPVLENVSSLSMAEERRGGSSLSPARESSTQD